VTKALEVRRQTRERGAVGANCGPEGPGPGTRAAGFEPQSGSRYLEDDRQPHRGGQCRRGGRCARILCEPEEVARSSNQSCSPNNAPALELPLPAIPTESYSTCSGRVRSPATDGGAGRRSIGRLRRSETLSLSGGEGRIRIVGSRELVFPGPPCIVASDAKSNRGKSSAAFITGPRTGRESSPQALYPSDAKPMTKVPAIPQPELACFPIPHSHLQCNLPGKMRQRILKHRDIHKALFRKPDGDHKNRS
jgi:hypothetical protein